MSHLKIKYPELLRMNSWFLPATVLCLGGLAASAQAPQPACPPQAARHFEAKITVVAKLDYLLYLPEGYATSRKKWPLMLFLHGSGESGTNLAMVKTHGPPKLVESSSPSPASRSSWFRRNVQAPVGDGIPMRSTGCWTNYCANTASIRTGFI
jgi:hypothetical protein